MNEPMYDSMLTLHGFDLNRFAEKNAGILNGDRHLVASKIEYEKFAFPDGSGHLKLHGSGERPLVVASPSNMGELMDVVLAKDALDRLRVSPVCLAMPYVLGSRQDRVCVPGEPLTARVVADIINRCRFHRVYIWHPHSEVIPALIDNVVVMPGIAKEVISSNLWNKDNGVLVAPDAGAVKAVHALSTSCGVPMVSAEKVRDMETGKIIKFAVHACIAEILKKDVMIVDDALTNGGTFLGLLTEIDKLKPNSVSLCVTHADHAEGVCNMITFGDKPSRIFSNVFISNSRSWVNTDPIQNFRVKVFPLTLGD